MIILFNYCADMKNYESFKSFSYIYIYIYIYILCLVAKKFSFPLFYRMNLFLLLLFFNNSIGGEEKFEHCISLLEKPEINN